MARSDANSRIRVEVEVEPGDGEPLAEVQLDFGGGVTRRLGGVAALTRPAELVVPNPEGRPLRPVDLAALPELVELARRLAHQDPEAGRWTPEALAMAIARDPIPALALSTDLEAAARVLTLIRVTGAGGFERVASLAMHGGGALVLPLTLPRTPPPELYGWGYPPGPRQCAKLWALPRRCLPLRTVVDPGLPSCWAELMFKRHLLPAERRRLFGWGLTLEQVEAAERFYKGLDPYDARKLEQVKTQEIFDAHRAPPATARDVQDSAHAWFGQGKPLDLATLSDGDLVHTLFAGMRPVWPERDEGGGWKARFAFSAFERNPLTENEGYFLPEVTVHLDDRLQTPTSVTYAYGPGEPETVATPADPEWRHAKRLARVAGFVAGQFEAHVAAHLLVESLEMAARRALDWTAPAQAVFEFLEPFFLSTSELDNYGIGLIVGDDGILTRGTGFSSAGATHYAAWALGRMDWRDFRPRAPLFAGDPYAERAAAAWDFVEAYLDAHMPRLDSHEAAWRALVEELVAHSVPCTAPGAKGDFHPAVHGEIPAPPHDARRPRGQALSEPDLDGPNAADELRQLLAFFLYAATFVHTHANDQQLYEGGDLSVTPLGVRLPWVNGAPVPRVPTDDDDYWAHFAPRRSEGALQLFLVESLSRIWSPRVVERAPPLLSWLVPGDTLEKFARPQTSGTIGDLLYRARLRRAPSI